MTYVGRWLCRSPVLVVPFVDGWLHPETAAAVAGHGWPSRFVQLDADDEGAYGRLIRQLWRAGETFVICEHDVVPTREQLATICTCAHEWCYFDYASSLYPPGPVFGLVRFAAAAMEAHPLAAEVALVIGKRRDEEAQWWHVDSLMARDLLIRGLRPAEHLPPVVHLHRGPPSGSPG